MKWLRYVRSPRLNWIQVEVSSHCNSSCIYCPNTVYRDRWLNRHMELKTFRNLLPAFVKTGLVFLQGWGEPLLNPDFFTMVSLAKEAGRRVGTTTNGMCLDEEKLSELMESGIDIVAFSLAGTDENNDTIRKGTSFERIMSAIRTLARMKAERNTARPAIHIAYLLLRSGMDDVGRLPSLAQDLGVNQIVISTLDFVPSSKLVDETIVHATSSEYDELRSRLDALAESGERLGVPIHYYLASPERHEQGIEQGKAPLADRFGLSDGGGLACTENIRRALFISADGSISPCVFTNLPVSEPVIASQSVERSYQRVVFGNVNEQSLESVWQRKDYTAFRRSFVPGRIPGVCQGCPKIYRM
ncbi:MAG: radical SAM protein [bacterium]